MGDLVLTVFWRRWSGTFLVELQICWADEWENITGATLTWLKHKNGIFLFCIFSNKLKNLTSSVSRAVLTELWDRSTIIPSRFISLMTVCRETRFELRLEPGWLERGVRQFILCRGRKSCGEKITKKWNKTRSQRPSLVLCPSGLSSL